MKTHPIAGRVIFATAVVALFAGQSIAQPTVTYDLVLNPNGFHTWEVRATTSPSDNAGLASYSFELDTPVGTTIEHVSPLAQLLGPARQAGFSQIRSNSGEPWVYASQDTFGLGDEIVAGFGQTSGDLSTLPSYDSGTTAYSGNVVLARGEWSTVAPMVRDTPELLANVLLFPSGTSTVPADVVLTSTTASTCIADWDGDGNVSTNDILAFLSSMETDSLRADVDASGQVDFFDLLAVLAATCDAE